MRYTAVDELFYVIRLWGILLLIFTLCQAYICLVLADLSTECSSLSLSFTIYVILAFSVIMEKALRFITSVHFNEYRYCFDFVFCLASSLSWYGLFNLIMHSQEGDIASSLTKPAW